MVQIAATVTLVLLAVASVASNSGDGESASLLQTKLQAKEAMEQTTSNLDCSFKDDPPQTRQKDCESKVKRCFAQRGGDEKRSCNRLAKTFKTCGKDWCPCATSRLVTKDLRTCSSENSHCMKLSSRCRSHVNRFGRKEARVACLKPGKGKKDRKRGGSKKDRTKKVLLQADQQRRKRKGKKDRRFDAGVTGFCKEMLDWMKRAKVGCEFTGKCTSLVEVTNSLEETHRADHEFNSTGSQDTLVEAASLMQRDAVGSELLNSLQTRAESVFTDEALLEKGISNKCAG